MKRRLVIFLACLLIVAIGIGTSGNAIFKTRVPVYESRKAQLTRIPDTYVYRSSGAGLGMGLAVFGIGAGIGIPLILKRKST